VRNLEEGHKKLVLALAVTPDGRRGSFRAAGTTRYVSVDLPTGRLERTLNGTH